MRNFKVFALLAVMILTAGAAHASDVPANPFSGFGLFTEYRTNSNVMLSVGGEPDYSGVSYYYASDFGLAGRLNDDAYTGSLPYGTLTVTSGDKAGVQYRLTPYTRLVSSYMKYSYSDIDDGSTVMWNLYTSPDVVVGSAVLKRTATVSIDRSGIVPYVKATPLTGLNSSRVRVDVSFVKSGDWGVPVAVDYDAVTINGTEVPDFRNSYPVRHTYTTYASYSYARTVTVICYKDGASYSWTFSIPASSIDFGKLSLDNQPLTIKAGETETITVKLPSAYSVSVDTDGILTVGNASVLEVGDITLTQGKGWISSDSEDKSLLEFSLTGLTPGRTTLELNLDAISPYYYQYYREINVVDASGDMELEEGTTSLHPLLRHTTYANYTEGKPDYTTARDNGFEISGLGGFTGAVEETNTYTDSSGDVHTYTRYTGPSGFMGTVSGMRHNIYVLQLDTSTGQSYSFLQGVRFSTDSTDRYYNGEYSSSITFRNVSEIEGVNVWLEFPDSTDMNLSSMTYTAEVISASIPAASIRTTEQQLEDFVPYFEIKGSSLDWSFVKPDTMSKVTPSGISNIMINSQTVTGTSGTIDFDSDTTSVNFRYTYNGTIYVWGFSGSRSYEITAGSLTPSFTVGGNTVAVVEGSPVQESVSFADYVRITLTRNQPITWNAYYANRSALTGTLHVSDDMSNDVTYELYPYLQDTYYSGDYTEYGTLTYETSSPYFKPGKTVRWVFSSDLVANGSATIPAIDSTITDGLTTTLKLNREGLNAKSLEWSVNASGDTSGVNMYVNAYAGGEISSDAGSGTVNVGLPEAFLGGINFSIERGNMTYEWNYSPVDMPSSYYYYDEAANVFTWNTDNPELPLSMKKGDTREIILSVSDDFGNIKPLVGNPEIVSMSVIASTDSTATVRLTALEAGMTTLGMTYQHKYVETVYPDGGDISASALPGSRSTVELDESSVIDIVLNSDGTATAGGSTVPEYDYVWHADPQHPAEYWTLGTDGTTELDSDAYEAAIEAAGTVSGLYIAHDIRYTPDTLDFSTSNTAKKDEDTEYVVYYDATSSAVAEAIAKLGETYGTAYSTDKYIFATLPMSNGGGNPGGGEPGGDTRPDMPGGSDDMRPDIPGGISGDTRPDFPGGGESGDSRPTPPSSDDDTRMPVLNFADSSIAAASTMTHSASDAYSNPVLHITEPGTYRISGTWKGQIWIEAGAKAKHQVALILNGVDVECTVAPALVFYKVYKWAEDNGYAEQSTLTANDLWKTLDAEMISSDGSYSVGAIVQVADGTTNTFTGANNYRILELSPKLDDDDNPKYSASEIGSNISAQQKMYKLDGAFHSRRTMIIGGGSAGTGTLNITSTTCEGLDSEMHMLIDGGNITVSAPDDGINVNEDNVSVFLMNSGTLTVSSTNADGIDSNGWVAVNGGTLNITAGNQAQNSAGEAGIDAENGVYISDSATYNWTAAGSGSPTTPDVPTPTSPDVPVNPASDDKPSTRVTYYGNYIAWPREIWVSELDSSTGKYRVPHLTDDVDALISSLGGNTGWTSYSTTGDTTPATPEYDESPKNVGYAGLSVYPRFAMPQDPSADAYKAALDLIDGLNLPYGVDMLNDNNMTVIASRDAVTVWNAMKDELLSADIPQLVAIVLPEMMIREQGFYVFRLPADNITASSQAIFWNAELSGDVYSYSYHIDSEDLSRQMFLDDSGNVTGAVSGDEYINVAAYLAEGVYLPVITAAATSNDLYILSNPPAPDTSPDVSPDIPVNPTSPDNPVNPTNPSQDIPAPTSPDNPVTPTSPDVTPVAPTRPNVDVDTVSNVLRNILDMPGAQVLELPATSTGSTRTVANVPSSQLSAIRAQGREVAAVLPEITVETAAIYLFGVSLDLTPGTAIFLDMTTRVAGTEAVKASANYDGDYTFLDDSGNEVYTVPANRHVNLAAYLEPGYTYSPVITTSGNTGETIGVGSSSGGCSTGISAAALIALLAAIRRKK